MEEETMRHDQVLNDHGLVLPLVHETDDGSQGRIIDARGDDVIQVTPVMPAQDAHRHIIIRNRMRQERARRVVASINACADISIEQLERVAAGRARGLPYELDVEAPPQSGAGEAHTGNPEHGVALRDYFIAHAPAEPQPWFKPVMDSAPEPPKYIEKPLTDEEKHEIEGLGDGFMGLSDITQPRVLAYATARVAHDKLARAYMVEYEKQSYVQWPAAWADEQLKARG